MLKPSCFVTAAFAFVAMAGQASAGIPVLIVGNPEASAQARSIHAVLTVKPAGCLSPASTNVTATAAGIVHGERRSLPLKVTALPGGLYAVTQQWPGEGKWVLHITATDGTRTASALVPAGPNGAERGNARFFTRQAWPGDIEAMLNGQPPAVAQK